MPEILKGGMQERLKPRAPASLLLWEGWDQAKLEARAVKVGFLTDLHGQIAS